MERKLILSPEYLEFEKDLPQRAKQKLLYAISILKTVCPIPQKFVKNLINTPFYELRVSADNEIRVILFAVDNDNINLSSNVILLNGFIKKGTKDYEREIKKSINILRGLL